MKQLTVPTDQKYLNATFLDVRPSNTYYQVNDNFMLLFYGSQKFINNVTLISKETIHLNDVTPQISYLAKDCDVEIFKEIFKDYTLKTDGMIDVLVFSSIPYTRRYVAS